MNVFTIKNRRTKKESEGKWEEIDNIDKPSDVSPRASSITVAAAYVIRALYLSTWTNIHIDL